MTQEQGKQPILHKFECRRHKHIEVYDERLVVKNLTVLDPSKDYALFDDCKSCGYGSKMLVLKTREAPFERCEIKGCTVRQVM